VCQKEAILEEEFVVITSLIFTAGEALKAIEIQLALKGCQLGELEIVREKLCEFLGLVHHKTASVWLPGHNVFVTVLNRLFQNAVEFERKWGSDTATSGLIFSIVNTTIMSMIMIVVLDGDVRMMLASTGGKGSSI
jgi:hypothetical protein